MATYQFLLWSIGNLTTTGPDPFANHSDPNTSAPGNSTLTIDAGPSLVSIEDDDANFEDGDNSQLVGGNQTDTEYSYVLRPTGSSDPSENITIFVVFEGATLLGITSDQHLSNGATYDVISIASSGPSVAYSNLVVCFGPGTMVETQEGPRAVENLQVGDFVVTRDHGPKPIRWIRCKDHTLDTAADGDKPILIKADALGRNVPNRDLVVSPQHRILVGGAGQLTGVFEEEALAPAKSLTKLPGIRQMKGKTKITWFHFACDRHEVVLANQCAVESLLLGPMVLKALSNSERYALRKIFGGMMPGRATLNGPPVRPCLKVKKVRQRLGKNPGTAHPPCGLASQGGPVSHMVPAGF